jgi:hypothetical protein
VCSLLTIKKRVWLRMFKTKLITKIPIDCVPGRSLRRPLMKTVWVFAEVMSASWSRCLLMRSDFCSTSRYASLVKISPVDALVSSVARRSLVYYY